MTLLFVMLAPSLLCGLLASVCAGALGPLIAVRRLGSMAGSLSHAVLGGVGIAVWINSLFGQTILSPLYGAFLVALACAVILSYIKHTSSQHEDAATAAIWAIGMSVGILFLTSTPGLSIRTWQLPFWLSALDCINSDLTCTSTDSNYFRRGCTELSQA